MTDDDFDLTYARIISAYCEATGNSNGAFFLLYDDSPDYPRAMNLGFTEPVFEMEWRNRIAGFTCQDAHFCILPWT
jgi:hypothetical protein